MVNSALHFLDQSKSNLFKSSHGFNIPIPKYVFNEDYPIDPKTFGERLRKARIDAGLRIKEFAEFIGVTDDTVNKLGIKRDETMKERYQG